MITILVLCTGNSARSVLGEALLNRLGEGRVRAFSAGSRPVGRVHQSAARLLEREGFDAGTFRSKSWEEFAGPDAPRIDVAITVCGSAAGEACPVFPGSPVRAHWGLADPAGVTGEDAAVDAAFAETWRLLKMRVEAFLAQPLETMTPAELQRELAAIGRLEGAA
jgi:arsenate reductase